MCSSCLSSWLMVLNQLWNKTKCNNIRRKRCFNVFDVTKNLFLTSQLAVL